MLLFSPLSTWLNPNCAYVIMRMNKFLMGKAIRGPVMQVVLSSQLEFSAVCQAQADRASISEGEVYIDLAGEVWIQANNLEMIQTFWMFFFPPRSSCNHPVQTGECRSFWLEPENSPALCRRFCFTSGQHHCQLKKPSWSRSVVPAFSEWMRGYLVCRAPQCWCSAPCLLRQDFRWPLMTLYLRIIWFPASKLMRWTENGGREEYSRLQAEGGETAGGKQSEPLWSKHTRVIKTAVTLLYLLTAAIIITSLCRTAGSGLLHSPKAECMDASGGRVGGQMEVKLIYFSNYLNSTGR